MKFEIGEKIVCKKDFGFLKEGDEYIVSNLAEYIVSDLASNMGEKNVDGFVLIRGGWYSENLFESTRKIRIDKINTILDGF